MGRIVAHQEMPSGRTNLLLQQVAASRLSAEVITDHRFRLARVAPVPESEPRPEELEGVRRLALQLVANGVLSGASERLGASIDVGVVDALARAVLEGSAARRAYLVAQNATRVRLLESVLAGLLARVSAAAGAA